ncbi:MAG: hypothetical protein HY744_25370 [Deltaproteobacteria bacterium]|nr:hypothetical protein [Deltaproteobacteria bacterium]
MSGHAGKISVVLGGLAGLGAAVAYSAWSGRSATPAASGPVAGAADGSAVRAAAGRARERPPPSAADGELAALRRRLARLEASQRPADVGESSRREVKEPDLDEIVAKHEQALQEHAASPVDAAWAPRASPLARAHMEAGAALGQYRVVRVDCRTTTCIGVVEWPSYADATAQYGELLHQDYSDFNCAREITLPPPQDPAAPYQGTVVFDCTELRASEP